MKIDFILNPSSRYGVLQSFEKGFREAFEKRGIETAAYEIDIDLPDHLSESCADYTMGINVTLPDELAKVPHIAYMVDWPTYSPILFSSKRTIACNVDRQAAAFLKQSGACRSIFLPHAVDCKLTNDRETARDIDVLFIGSFSDAAPLAENLQKSVSEKFFVAIEAVIEQTLASRDTNHVYSILKLLKEFPDYQKELKNLQISVNEFCNQIEQIMRSKDRVNLMLSIDREVHIYGDDRETWKKVLKNKKNCIYHPAIDFLEIDILFQRTRIVLNSVPMLKEGLHERLLHALIAGASCVSNQNLLLPAFFSENRAFGTFLSPAYQEVNRVIDRMLEDEGQRQADVRKSQETISLHHTWDQRAAQLIAYLESF